MSLPFSRAGTGRASGWYGSRVCSIEVSVVGPLSRLPYVRNALDNAPLLRLQFNKVTHTDRTNNDRDKTCTNTDETIDETRDGIETDKSPSDNTHLCIPYSDTKCNSELNVDATRPDTDTTVLFSDLPDSDMTRLNTDLADTDATGENSDTYDTDMTRLFSDLPDSDMTRLNTDLSDTDMTRDTDATPLLIRPTRNRPCDYTVKKVTKVVRTDDVTRLNSDTTDNVITPLLVRPRKRPCDYTCTVRKELFTKRVRTDLD